MRQWCFSVMINSYMCSCFFTCFSLSCSTTWKDFMWNVVMNEYIYNRYKIDTGFVNAMVNKHTTYSFKHHLHIWLLRWMASGLLRAIFNKINHSVDQKKGVLLTSFSTVYTHNSGSLSSSLSSGSASMSSMLGSARQQRVDYDAGSNVSNWRCSSTALCCSCTTVLGCLCTAAVHQWCSPHFAYCLFHSFHYKFFFLCVWFMYLSRYKLCLFKGPYN